MIEQRYVAVVVENDDQKVGDGVKLGRIQIRILPELIDVADKDLPWARPYSSPRNVTYRIPRIGDTVEVVGLDPIYKNLFYTFVIPVDSNVMKNGATYDSLIQSRLDMVKPTGQAYPDVDVTRYDDGTVIFANTQRGDYGIVHNTGTVIYVNKLGKVTIKGGQGDSLKEQLSELQDILSKVVNGANWVGNLGAPVIYKEQATATAALSALQTSIDQLYGE